MLPALWLLLAATATQATPGGDGAGAPQLTGVTTSIIPSLCVPDGTQTLRCAGYAGIDVFLIGPRERQAIAFGDAARPSFPPLPVAGRLGRSVDWRIGPDGAPLAASVSWRAAEGSVELVLLLRPARKGALGCLSAVAAPMVDLEERVARRFRCGEDRPVLAGPVPPGLRMLLEPWLAAQQP